MITCYYDYVRTPISPTVAANLPQPGMVVETRDFRYRVIGVNTVGGRFTEIGQYCGPVVSTKLRSCGKDVIGTAHIPLPCWREYILLAHMKGWGV